MKPIFAEFGRRRTSSKEKTIQAQASEIATLRAKIYGDKIFRALIQAAAALDTEPETTDAEIESSGDFSRIRTRRALRACQDALI